MLKNWALILSALILWTSCGSSEDSEDWFDVSIFIPGSQATEDLRSGVHTQIFSHRTGVGFVAPPVHTADFGILATCNVPKAKLSVSGPGIDPPISMDFGLNLSWTTDWNTDGTISTAPQEKILRVPKGNARLFQVIGGFDGVGCTSGNSQPIIFYGESQPIDIVAPLGSPVQLDATIPITSTQVQVPSLYTPSTWNSPLVELNISNTPPSCALENIRDIAGNFDYFVQPLYLTYSGTDIHIGPIPRNRLLALIINCSGTYHQKKTYTGGVQGPVLVPRDWQNLSN